MGMTNVKWEVSTLRHSSSGLVIIYRTKTRLWSFQDSSDMLVLKTSFQNFK